MTLHLQLPQDEHTASRPGADAIDMPPETFEIFIDDDRYAVPTLYLITAEDQAGAMRTAERMVADSAHHLGAELCQDGLRIAGVGSFALRQLPLGGPSRQPTES